MAQALAKLAGEVYSSTDVGFPPPPASALLPSGYQRLADDIEGAAAGVLLYLAVLAALIPYTRPAPGCVGPGHSFALSPASAWT